MATELAKAYVQIVPSADGIKGSIEKVLGGEADNAGKSAGNKVASGIGKALGGAGKVIGASLGVALAGVSAATGAFISGAKEVAAYGDEIDKASQKIGVSSSFYQEWEAVMQHSGTSMSSMTASFKTLANASQGATKDQAAAFEQLGMSMDDVAKMSSEDLFKNVINGLQGMEESTERTALATTLLGRGAMELGPLLNTSAEDTQGMIDTVNKLGGVMSEDAVKASARFQDSLQDLQTGFSGLKNNLMADFLPGISDVMDGLTALVSGDSSGLGTITQGINSLATNITNSLPSIMNAGASIILSLGDAILQNLPTLINCAFDVIMQLADGIIQNLPMILEAGLQVLLNLALGIAQAIPELIPTLIDVVFQMQDTLLDNIDLLIDAAIELMVALSVGLMEALPRLVARIPEIVVALVSAIIRNAPKMLMAALELMNNIGIGITNSKEALKDKIKELLGALVQKIQDGAKELLEAGKGIVNNILEGIKGAWDNLTGWIGEGIKGIKNAFSKEDSDGEAEEAGEKDGKAYAEGAKKSAQSALQSLFSDYSSNEMAFTAALGVNPSGSGVLNTMSAMQDILSDSLLNVNIGIEPDSERLFKVVRREANIYSRTTGKEAFA